MLIKRAEVTFKIPYLLEWQGFVEVKIGNGQLINMKLESVKEDTDNIRFNGGFVRGDRYGRYNTTAVTCYFDCNLEDDLVKLNNNQKYYYNRSKQAINKLLYVYKHTYNEYYISPFKDTDILEYNIKFFKEDSSIAGCYMSNFGGGSIVLGNISTPSEEILDLLKSEVRFPLWQEYWYKAKDDYDLEDYTQCLININIALENFIYTHFKERLMGKLSDEAINKTLNVYTPCSNCKLKSSNENHIKPGPPSIYKIVKVMYRMEPANDHKVKDINRLVSSINRYRNDIVHGTFSETITPDCAETAVNSFEKLVSISLGAPLMIEKQTAKISNLGFAF